MFFPAITGLFLFQPVKYIYPRLKYKLFPIENTFFSSRLGSLKLRFEDKLRLGIKNEQVPFFSSRLGSLKLRFEDKLRLGIKNEQVPFFSSRLALSLYRIMIYMIKRSILSLILAIVFLVPASPSNYSVNNQLPLSASLELNPFFTDYKGTHSLKGLTLTGDNPDKPGFNKSAAIVVGTEALIITGIMSSLYISWYAGSETGGFHFFNDNGEWLLMDKFGHANSCYNFANIGYEALVMTGMDEKHSILYGAPLGITIMSLVEIFDGLSSDWGFSWGDMGANVLGTGLFMAQQAIWHEQRIAMKYSYHNSGCPKYDIGNPITMERDYIMGKDWLDRLYEDYSGITIWLACDVKSLLMKDTSRYPSWLGWAIGYGAEGMTGEYNNYRPEGKAGTDGNWGRGWEHDGIVEYMPNDARQRRLFLAPDIDISRIPCKNKTLKHVLRVLSAIKIPTPTLEYRPGEDRLCWHWFYF